MSNNRDDSYESQDDSEYHFSDDEVSYEVESDTPKASPAASSAEPGTRVSRPGGSKRILISAGVFVAIVFVVYKMFSPSASTPPTDITAAPVTAQTSAPANQAAPTQVAAAPAVQAPASAPAPQVQVTAPAPAVPAPVAQAAQPAQPPVAQPQAAPQPAPVATLPNVIPVQSAPAPANQSPLAAMGTLVEEKSAALSNASQQVASQVQSQYTQQFNEFSAQNKSLQNQVQSLSTRVAEMEAQINQMVQVLTRRNNTVPAGSSMNNPVSQPPRSPDVRIAYNVQAIIPGRAWLKSENGETLTVAEGDVIRDVGRVTRIDPYDGIVEINTGTKAVSLSYGNGG